MLEADGKRLLLIEVIGERTSKSTLWMFWILTRMTTECSSARMTVQERLYVKRFRGEGIHFGAFALPYDWGCDPRSNFLVEAPMHAA